MKKILLLGMMMFGFQTIQAQTAFTTGARAGLNISTIEDIEASNKTGMYAGVFGNLRFAKFYSLQPELNFSMQGANKVHLSDRYFPETNGGKADVPLNYLGLSVINKFHFKSFNLQVGPTLDFLMSESIYNRNNVDLAINFGAGYDFTDNLSVEARYKMGVRDVVDDQMILWFFSDINYNSLFQIGLTYRFNQ